VNSQFSTLPMYPFAELRGAWNTLYESVAASVAHRFADIPVELDWSIGAHESWVSPRLALSQSCGWPLVTVLKDRVAVLGTFVHVIEGTSSHRYRSVIVARQAAPLSELVGRCVAINSDDSLSGCISLQTAAGVVAGEWPGTVLVTGSHLASIDAVRGGHADVASIDALTWEYQRCIDAHRLDGLVVVGRGPLVPCLPLIIGRHENDDHAVQERVQAWRSALTNAMSDSALCSARDTLLINGFVPLDLHDYSKALPDQTRSR
jgi:ABC-type phosphate/phosphonate transport system substrate-binding protein